VHAEEGGEVPLLVWGLLVYLCLLFLLFVWAAVERMRSARERTGQTLAELQLLKQITAANRVAVRANSMLPAGTISIGAEPLACLAGESTDGLAFEAADLAVLDEEA
jgi:hypothetical protein